MRVPRVRAVKVVPTLDGNRQVTVPCPFCGRQHRHGLPAGQSMVGHRLAHCEADTDHLGYVILLPRGVA